MNMTATRHRPFGVSLLSILMILAAIGELIAGIAIMATRNDDGLRAELGNVSKGTMTTLAIILFAFFVVDLIVAMGLRNGADWARKLIVVVVVLRVAALVWSVVSSHGYHWSQAVLPTLVYILVAGYLSRDQNVREYFDRA